MKVLWGILCKNVIVNRDTNNITLVEVLERVTITATPPEEQPEPDQGINAMLDIHLVSSWARSDPNTPEMVYAKFRVVAPDGRSLASEELEVDLTESRYLRASGHLLDAPFAFSGEGQYLFKIETRPPEPESEWKEVYELPFWIDVGHLSPPEPPPVP